MYNITITERLNGYTYFTASNGCISADFIIYDASTGDDITIWVELDSIDGVDYDIAADLSGWVYDGLLTEQEGIDRALYMLYQLER